MKNKRRISLLRVGLFGGLFTFWGLTAYFLTMRYLNLLKYTELRVFNLFILIAGIVLTLRYVRRNTVTLMQHLDGFGLLCLVSAASVIPFSVFIYIYFGVLDPGALMQLKGHSPMMGQFVTPFTAFASVLTEGILSGLVISFSYMQYFQNRFAH